MSAGSPAPSTAAPDPVLRRWRNAVFVIFWLTGFLLASWATRVPNVRDILEASTGQMGLLILGLAAGSVLGLFASSHVIARLGATATILVCMSSASAGLVVVGVVATFAPGLRAPVRGPDDVGGGLLDHRRGHEPQRGGE